MPPTLLGTLVGKLLMCDEVCGLVYDQNNIDTAISRQHTATYGDFRSPTRAAFQKVPNALKAKAIRNWETFD